MENLFIPSKLFMTVNAHARGVQVEIKRKSQPRRAQWQTIHSGCTHPTYKHYRTVSLEIAATVDYSIQKAATRDLQ